MQAIEKRGYSYFSFEDNRAVESRQLGETNEFRLIIRQRRRFIKTQSCYLLILVVIICFVAHILHLLFDLMYNLILRTGQSPISSDNRRSTVYVLVCMCASEYIF